MPMEVYYRSGQAAKMLGLSSYQLRRLAESELIDAEFTGNQWRFPASAIQELLKNGIPEIPAADPDGAETEAASRNGNRHSGGDRDADPTRSPVNPRRL